MAAGAVETLMQLPQRGSETVQGVATFLLSSLADAEHNSPAAMVAAGDVTPLTRLLFRQPETIAVCALAQQHR